VLLVLHVGLLAYSATQHSPTIDEVAHMAAGVSHWELGRFDLYRVNPPLVRMLATLPVMLAGYESEWSDYSAAPGTRAEFRLGEKFIDRNGTRAFRLFTWARWACIPLSVLGALICWRWAGELFGSGAALLALSLWCFSPAILGNAPMIVPDTGATALGLAAMYTYWNWLRANSWSGAYLAGLVFGMSQLTKATLSVFFVLYPLIWLLWQILPPKRHPDTSCRTATAQLVLCLTIGLLTLNLGYGLEGCCRPLGEYQFVSRSLSSSSVVGGNRFAGTWLSRVPVPLPANYVMGVDTQKRDFERRMWSYLRGQWRFGGWWYYYLYAAAVKMPVGLVLLIVLAIAWAMTHSIGRVPLRDELMLAIPSLAVLALVSSQTGFNHHVRYVLPALPYVFISVSRIASVFPRRCWWTARLTLIAWSAFLVGSVSVYPHSMSYFSELIGGPRRGPEHLVDSNIDWGQDLMYLHGWQQSHRDSSPLGLAYFGEMRPEVAGIRYQLPPCADAQVAGAPSLCPKSLQPGWYAVSVSLLRGIQYQIHAGGGKKYWTSNNCFTYFQRLRPTAMAGYSIYIYCVTPAQLDQLRRDSAETSTVPGRDIRTSFGRPAS
jgi:4-amino-4-deoxy-L-arabinose transferase-like glycosyltransferase